MQVHARCHTPKTNKQFLQGVFFYLDRPHFLNTEGRAKTTEVGREGGMGRAGHLSSLPQSQLGLCKQLCQFLTTVNTSILLPKITSLRWICVHTSQARNLGRFSIGIDSWCTQQRHTGSSQPISLPTSSLQRCHIGHCRNGKVKRNIAEKR